MKKTSKTLELNRETLLAMQTSPLARGGGITTNPFDQDPSGGPVNTSLHVLTCTFVTATVSCVTG